MAHDPKPGTPLTLACKCGTRATIPAPAAGDTEIARCNPCRRVSTVYRTTSGELRWEGYLSPVR